MNTAAASVCNECLRSVTQVVIHLHTTLMPIWPQLACVSAACPGTCSVNDEAAAMPSLAVAAAAAAAAAVGRY